MSEDSGGGASITTVLFLITILLSSTILVGQAFTSDVPVEGEVPFQANSGMEVTVPNQFTPATLKGGGTIYQSDTRVRLNANNAGAAEFNSSAAVSARVQTLSAGGFTNVTNLDVTAGNLTLNPDGDSPTTLSGDFDSLKVEGQAEVDDGKIDLIYEGVSGSGLLVLQSDGSQGEAFAAVDEDTGDALDIAIAGAGGELTFDNLPMSRHRVTIQSTGTLTVRDVADPHPLVTGANLTARFFDEGSELVAVREDTDGDGKVDLTGLPVGDRFTVQVNHPDFHQRRVVVPDLSQQKNIFLLNTSADPQSVEQRLVVADTTGQFSSPETQLVLQRPINSSRFGVPIQPEERQFRNVIGSDLGANSAITEFVQTNTRYRVQLQAADGDTISLGSFNPTASGTTTFTVESGVFNGTQRTANDVEYQVNRTNRTGQSPKIIAKYNDTDDQTDALFVKIFERNNESNVLLANTTFTGPLGEVIVSEPIPQAQRDTDYVVQLVAQRSGGENVRVVEPISPRRDVLGGLPVWLASIISVSLILLTAGLSSQLNGKVGGVAVAGVGGLLWFAGIAPPSLGAGVVALALVVAGLMMLNDRNDGGL